MCNKLKLSIVFIFFCFSQTSLSAFFLNNKILPDSVGVASFASEFGSQIVYFENQLVVSGPNLAASGAVIYFEYINDNWVEKQQILPTGNIGSISFGSTITMHSDLLVVGAPSTSQFQSNDAVYIYDLIDGQWILSKKISELNIDVESFGSVVSTNGTEIALSAERCVFTFSVQDCVIILKKDGLNWVESQYVLADGPPPNGFNNSIILHEENLFIGATRDSTVIGHLVGAVYDFKKEDGEWKQSQKIFSSDGFRYDDFGVSINYTSDKLLIGAPGQDATGQNNGAVYEFRKVDNSWTELDKITIPTDSEDMFFGHSIDILGNTMLVGRKSDSISGSFSDHVYLFKNNNGVWYLTQTIVNPEFGRFGSFGQSLVLTKNSIFIGEPTAQDRNWTGYLHKYNQTESGTWIHDRQIEPLTGSPGSSVGEKISLNSNYLYVASPDEYVDENKRGAVRVFEHTDTGFEQQTVLNGSENYSYTEFGYNIISNENILVVGSPLDQESGQFGGAVHIFDQNNSWNQLQKITPEAYGEESRFGMSIGIDDNLLAISAPFKSISGTNVGAVYTYERNKNKWIFKSSITSPLGLSDDRFGVNLHLNKEHLFITSLYNNDISWSTGEVDMYYNNGQSLNHIQRFTDLNENYRSIGNVIYIEGDLAAISAVTVEDNIGVVFLLKFNGVTWDFEQTVYPEDTLFSIGFGSSILISNGILYVGSTQDNEFGYSSGAIYEFKKLSDTWIQSNKIFAKGVPSSVRFGSSLAINQDDLICSGAPLDSDRGKHSGAVFCDSLEVIFQNGFEEISGPKKGWLTIQPPINVFTD